MKSLKIMMGLLLLSGAAFAQTLSVDTKSSKIEWVGKKVTGQHNGTVLIKSGEVKVEKGALKGGQFDIDMTTIEALDLQGEWHDKLVGHLKSDDFFSVEKNPTASFKITKIEKNVVSGDLTIKGMTHPLSFPAEIVVSKGKVTATAKGVVVDRTLYDIRYGSGKFFQNLGDKVIDDQFTLDITLVAGK